MAQDRFRSPATAAAESGGGAGRRPWLARSLWLIIVVILLGRVSIPVYIVAPGPTRSAAEMVSVTAPGVVAAGQRGDFLITTLAARQASVGTALLAAFNPRTRLLLGQQLMPPGQSMDDYLAENEELMRHSQLHATAAALDYLGFPIQVTGKGAEVLRVLSGVKPAPDLEPGDVIVSVDGVPVVLAQDLVAHTATRHPGASVELEVVRQGRGQQVTVATVATVADPAADPAAEPAGSVLPLQTWTKDLALSLPPDIIIEIDAGDISGPSAGLIFALEIANRFTAVDLTAGAVVAGTGTIGPDGGIGAVGGVPFKIAAAQAAGAQTFVMPPSSEGGLGRASRNLEVMTATRLGPLVEALVQRSEERAAATVGPVTPRLTAVFAGSYNGLILGGSVHAP